MENKKYYVYKWYNTDTNEVFYIGKGGGNRSGQISCRNEVFKEYYNTHNCDVKRIEFFDTEEEALKREHELILEYKAKNEAIANLDDGGKGGLSFSWTPEMRAYKSLYNPMKDENQRKRMSENNPMKNPEIAKKVALKTSRAVIINGIRYYGVLEAARQLKVSEPTIRDWCRHGYDTNGLICRYEDELNKEFPPFTRDIKSYYIGVYIDDKYYTNLQDAAKDNDLNYGWLAKKLRDNNGYTIIKNHICKYANQQPSQENNQ